MSSKIITRTILLLSLVSLFTDIASEMLYPVMPVYLRSIGFSVVMIGVLEGLAEAITGLSKGYFGHLSDQSGKRLPFVRIGYLLSALSKPMMAVLSAPLWIFFARSTDRTGKGIRTSARDALLSDESSEENKGKVFGFHRAMDTLGATVGPVAALIYLHFYPQQYRSLFLLAFIPGLFAVAFTFILNEKTKAQKTEKKSYSFFYFLSYWKKSPARYKYLIAGLLMFSLFNSSDVFLLLMLKEKGVSDAGVIKVYIFYNLCYALLSYPLGHLGDRFGLRRTYISGIIVFAVVYLGMAFSSSTLAFYLLFFLYGLYAAATEGISKAWISNCIPRAETATAIGFYGSFNSLMAIAASSGAGILWNSFYPSVVFMVSGAGVLAVAGYFLVNRKI